MTANPLVFNKKVTDMHWTAGAAEHRTPKK
jgi:hypothetical protein